MNNKQDELNHLKYLHMEYKKKFKIIDLIIDKYFFINNNIILG